MQACSTCLTTVRAVRRRGVATIRGLGTVGAVTAAVVRLLRLGAFLAGVGVGIALCGPVVVGIAVGIGAIVWLDVSAVFTVVAINVYVCERRCHEKADEGEGEKVLLHGNLREGWWF